MNIENILERMKEDAQPIAVRAYTALHAQAGCRISDLLAINYTSISQHLNISILQGKGSQALVIQPLYFREFWQMVYNSKLSPMELYNRFYFYRLYKRYGIGISKGKHRNSFVTHAFRKHLADDIYSIDQDNKRVQGALGHRSAKSSEHYTAVVYKKK